MLTDIVIRGELDVARPMSGRGNPGPKLGVVAVQGHPGDDVPPGNLVALGSRARGSGKTLPLTRHSRNQTSVYYDA